MIVFNILCGFIAGATAAFLGSSFLWAVGTGVVVFLLWTLYDLVIFGSR